MTYERCELRKQCIGEAENVRHDSPRGSWRTRADTKLPLQSDKRSMFRGKVA